MNPCMAFKTDGARCTSGSVPATPHEVPLPAHVHLCATHQRIYRTRYTSNNNTHHTAGCCFDAVGTRRLWCTNPADETGRCATHAERLVARGRRQAAYAQRRERFQNALTYFTNRVPMPPWRQALRELLAPDAPAVIRHPNVNYIDVIRTYYMMARVPGEPMWWRRGVDLVLDYRIWLIQGEPVGREPQVEAYLPPPVPVAPRLPPPLPLAPAPTSLAVIAQDSQNVHRAVVSQQTNTNVDLLLATPDVPPDCRAHELLAAVWLEHGIAGWARVRRTVDDMADWRNRDTCKVAGDWLYRRLLHALFTRISRMPDTPVRTELWKRFYEECSESVSLCCEGHISRLCNVMVGFDDAFKPPLSIGEVLQSEMSAIAKLDIPLESKVAKANALFDELGFPEEERGAWLEAF